jgi:uncharacterized protein (TIGR03435 family)
MKKYLIAHLIAASLPAWGQPAVTVPKFEVASVKPTRADLLDSNSRVPSLDAGPGSTLRLANITLKDVIMLAYHVGAAQISDPPLLFNRFDIIAKIPTDATKEQVPLMLQDLLARRFKLAFHREEKQIPVFVLEVNAPTPKLQDPAPGDSVEPGCTRSPSDKGTFLAVCHKMTSGGLVQVIQTLAPNYFDQPVLDATGLTGVYDFTLEWIAFSDSMSGGTGPTMFTAVQNLGLRLTTQKKSMDIFVIDNCAKEPIED